MITAQEYAGFKLTRTRAMIDSAQKKEKLLQEQLKQASNSAREISAEIESGQKRRREAGRLVGHEQSHYGREIEDLLARDEVEKVELLKDGIRVTTKPIHSFKGTLPFEIDLLIVPHDASSAKPIFRVVGESSGFQLKCLNGSGGGHDTEVAKMLKSARLAEAAMLALDLIQFGDEGGPHNDD